jgi:hypothetical protein
MMFDLPNASCAVHREEGPDKGYSTGLKEIAIEIEGDVGTAHSPFDFLEF